MELLTFATILFILLAKLYTWGSRKDFFTTEDLKRCFLNGCINGRIDTQFYYINIISLKLLVYIKKICPKDSTNGAVQAFSLIICLRMVSRYCNCTWAKQSLQWLPKVTSEFWDSVKDGRYWNCKKSKHILKKQQCNLLSCKSSSPI